VLKTNTLLLEWGSGLCPVLRVSAPKDCLASQELPISIGMAIDKGQPAVLDWLRAVAASIKPEVDAEMAKTVQTGP
jgi:hypothetical protein